MNGDKYKNMHSHELKMAAIGKRAILKNTGNFLLL